MPDVFISYTSRGLMNGELIAELADKIKRRYKATYATDLTIWHQSASAAGEDFKFNIKRALQNTTIFIPLLEAEYLSAPYTRLELSYYQEVRKRKKAKVHIIPLIIWRGRVEEELLDPVGSTVKALYYSRLTTDQAEVELEEREKENIIVELVTGIYTSWLDNSREQCLQNIQNALEHYKETFNIFVPVTTKSGAKQRQQFIQELSKTIASRTLLKPVIFPDQLNPQQVSYQHCLDLLCEENNDGKSALQAMLTISKRAIVFLANDDLRQTEKMLQSARFQFRSITAQEHLPIHECIDVPKEVIFLDSYREMVENHPPGLQPRIKVVQQRDVTGFVNSFLEDLLEEEQKSVPQGLPSEQPLAPRSKEGKKIYIIDHFFTEEDKEALSSRQLEFLSKELENKNHLFTSLREKNFGLLRCPPKILPLKEAMELKQLFIDQCDGIIIYRGAIEADDWYFTQQVETHKYLSIMKKNDAKKRLRAVCIDPLQNNRNHAEYFFFDFDVIDKQPEDLELFVCKL